jgi:hypothetical protein
MGAVAGLRSAMERVWGDRSYRQKAQQLQGTPGCTVSVC